MRHHIIVLLSIINCFGINLLQASPMQILQTAPASRESSSTRWQEHFDVEQEKLYQIKRELLLSELEYRTSSLSAVRIVGTETRTAIVSIFVGIIAFFVGKAITSRKKESQTTDGSNAVFNPPVVLIFLWTFVLSAYWLDRYGSDQQSHVEERIAQIDSVLTSLPSLPPDKAADISTFPSLERSEPLRKITTLICPNLIQVVSWAPVLIVLIYVTVTYAKPKQSR